MKSLKTIIILSIVVSGCVSNPVARPNGFMRIGMPEKDLQPHSSGRLSFFLLP